MRDTLFIWVEAYEYPSGLRIEAFLWSASIILGRFMKELFSSIIHLILYKEAHGCPLSYI